MLVLSRQPLIQSVAVICALNTKISTGQGDGVLSFAWDVNETYEDQYLDCSITLAMKPSVPTTVEWEDLCYIDCFGDDIWSGPRDSFTDCKKLCIAMSADVPCKAVTYLTKTKKCHVKSTACANPQDFPLELVGSISSVIG